MPPIAASEEVKTSGFMVNKAEAHQAPHCRERLEGAVVAPSSFALGFNEAFPAQV